MIRPVVAHAEARLGKSGRDPLPAGVTAHKLRHTFASILFVRGEDPPYVMAQLDHSDPAFTPRVYAHAMRRDAGDKEALKALVDGLIGHHWAPAGRMTPGAAARGRPRGRRKPRGRGASGGWARRVSNLRPLACEASALPLSYAPGRGKSTGAVMTGGPKPNRMIDRSD